jgi:hypothetical protein
MVSKERKGQTGVHGSGSMVDGWKGQNPPMPKITQFKTEKTDIVNGCNHYRGDNRVMLPGEGGKQSKLGS